MDKLYDMIGDKISADAGYPIHNPGGVARWILAGIVAAAYVISIVLV
ncbi:MAG: hypothetical protein ABEK59_03490 [Halobacteria archaeon]